MRGATRQFKVKAVFFDLDNTLFESATRVKRARINSVKAMIKAGLPLQSVDEGYQLLMEIVAKYGANYEEHFNRLLERLGHEASSSIVSAGVVAYHDTKLAFLKPDPDVIPTLQALRRGGFKLGIISNGRAIKQWEKLIRMRLHRLFHAVIISEEVGAEKPDARIFQLAVERLGLIPSKAVYVGDHLQTDILGANRAGLASILLLKGKRRLGKPASEEMKPACTIRKVSDLLKVLKLQH